MAGNARPSEDILIGSGNETDINIIDHNITSYHDQPSTLFDGNLSKHTMYGVLIYSNKYITFKTENQINFYAYGSNYSDSGGSTQQKLKLWKLNEDGKTFTDMGFNKNNVVTNKWALIFENISPGTYKITSSGSYVSVTELFIENSVSFLIKQNSDYYNISETNYSTLKKSFIPLIINNLHDDIISNSINLDNLSKDKIIGDETFKPIEKFINYQIVKLS